MPSLLKDGRIVEDPWQRVADQVPLPAEGCAIVSAKRWLAERDQLLGVNIQLGVELDPGTDVSRLADDLPRFGVVVVRFPAFSDGRGFSQARLLRERHGYRGEVRAAGHVLREEFLFLHRCGVNAVELADGDDATSWQRALAEIDVFYQPTGDGEPSVLRRRAARR
jgi:uncharacterized protein (DUF934 family)